MLSREIATTLGGRYLEKEVWPYSFQEYLRAAGVEEGPGRRYGKAAGEVARRFVEACETRKAPERISWADALRVFWLLQDAVDALRAGVVA